MNKLTCKHCNCTNDYISYDESPIRIVKHKIGCPVEQKASKDNREITVSNGIASIIFKLG